MVCFRDEVRPELAIPTPLEVFDVPLVQEAVAKIPKAVGKVGLLADNKTVSFDNRSRSIAGHHLHIPRHTGAGLWVHLDVGVELQEVIALRSAVFVLWVGNNADLLLAQSQAPCELFVVVRVVPLR